MSGADRFVSMALDDVIKHRRNEGGRGGFRRGGRGGRGGQNMQMQRGGRGGGMRGQRGFPQRIPGGRIAKNRVQNQGPRQQMPNFRGPRGGQFQRGGFVQRGRGRGNMQPHMMQQQHQFNPRVGLTTGHNQNFGGRMRAWTNEEPEQYQPSHTVPIRGRGRGGFRGGRGVAMRGNRGGQQNRPVRMQRNLQPQMQMQQQHHQEEEYVEQRVQQPRLTQAKKVQIARQLKSTTQTAKNRVRLATQVLMQRQRQLEQITQQSAAIERQAGLKTRGLRLRGMTTRGMVGRGAVQRVTGLRRGGGVVKRPLDARMAIKQKIVRAAGNRQRAIQHAQNQPMHVNISNNRLPPPPPPPQMMMMQRGPPQHMRPMPNRGFAVAAVRRAATFRRNQAQMGQMRQMPPRQMGRNMRQLTLHERFSNQSW